MGILGRARPNGSDYGRVLMHKKHPGIFWIAGRPFRIKVEKNFAITLKKNEEILSQLYPCYKAELRYLD